MDWKNETKKQWNTTPCGSQGEIITDLNYFLDLEKNRLLEHPWMKEIYPIHGGATNSKILEVGFGQGTDLVQFAKAGYECYGIDLTTKHYELANKNFSLRELKANLTLGDASKLPYEDEFFDVVYSFGVLHHTPDIDKCVDEIYRVLKREGEFTIALYNRNSAFYLISKLLVDGILKGWLFKLGIKGLRSTIEFGADGKNIKPLVILYTKKKTKNVLHKFKIESVTIKHLERSHFWKFGYLLPNWVIKKLEKCLGWYVIIKARKI